MFSNFVLLIQEYMYSLDSYDTLLCFKTNVAGYDYWWILDARASSVRVKLVTVHDIPSITAGPGRQSRVRTISK